jgi:hypothetical protein
MQKEVGIHNTLMMNKDLKFSVIEECKLDFSDDSKEELKPLFSDASEPF